MSELVDALWLSLLVAGAATGVVALVGVPLAYGLARRRFRGRSVVEAVLTLPLVLPPTVVGYFIIVGLGSRSTVGGWLREYAGFTLLFTVEGAVLAAAVVSLPLLLLPAKAAFASIDPELLDLARLLGAGRAQTFWHVALPLARRGIGSGLLLAFARALGEFGATVMVLGDLEGRRTLPILIYTDYVAGDLAKATPAVVLLTAVCVVVVVFYNRSLSRGD